jgi:TolB-like protein/cytochrome c-type biogenesis protein CcmH/NrfG
MASDKLPFEAYRGEDDYIFASYSHADSSAVYRELIRLNGEGFNLWYDEGITPTHRWTDELATAIDGCSLFLAFITPRFVASEHCINEIEYALRHGCSVLAVHLEPTQLPHGLELSLGSRQAIHRHKHGGEAFRQKLDRSLQTMLRRPRPDAQAAQTPADSRGPARFREFMERRVVRAAGMYVAVAWGITEILAFLAEALWGDSIVDIRRYLAILFIAGFPVAMYLAWIRQLGDRARRVISAVTVGIFVAAVLVWLLPQTPDAQRETSSAEFIKTDSQSIAVLPFVDMSGGPGQEHLSDGISEELIHRLSQLSGLQVAARTSSFYFKNKNVPISTVGRELQVSSVLEGSIRKSGDRIRVTVQLVDVDSGYHIWSQTIERAIDDIFAIQDEISSKVVESLKVSLLNEEKARLTLQPTDNLDAYDAYLLARQMMARRTSGSLHKAVGHFEKAVELDPEFALAYVGLADAYALLGSYGALDTETVLAQAEPALEHAMDLDDQLAEAYTTLASLSLLKGELDESKDAFQRAIQLNPNYAPAYLRYGMLMKRGFGNVESALELHQTALGLDPMSTAINMAVVEDYHELGKFEKVRERCERIIEIDPDYPRAYTIMADLYWEVFGELDEAVRWLHKAIELDPGNPDHFRWMGMVFLDLGDMEAGERWIRQAIRIAPTQYTSLWSAVYLHRYTGDHDKAVEAAEILLESARNTAQLPSGSVVEVAPADWLSLLVLRDADYRSGNPQAALERYRLAKPELVDGDLPAIDVTNFKWAIEIANVMIRIGRSDRAEKLLQGALTALQGRPRLGFSGYGISDVEIFALLGENDRAIEMLRTAVDEGWRSGWWINTEVNNNLVSLHKNPRYREIVQGIKIQMSEQLARATMLDPDDVPAGR